MLFFNIKKTLSLKNTRSLFVRPNTIQHKDVQKTETAPLTKKHPKEEKDHSEKMKENLKSHRSTPKVPLNLPDVLQNPKFTISHHDDQHEPN